MARTWSSGSWGQFFTKTPAWSLTIEGETITISVAGKPMPASIEIVEHLSIRAGVFWSAVVFDLPDQSGFELDGIQNHEGQEMLRVLRGALETYKRTVKVRELIGRFEEAVDPIVEWYDGVTGDIFHHLVLRGWINVPFVQRWEAAKPDSEIRHFLRDSELAAHLATRPQEVRDAVGVWRDDLRAYVDAANEAFLKARIVQDKDFFDRVEKSPLTEEQARAVVCFDDRVLVVASAGSGKTSTMVAKAGYALHRKFVSADKILMLAFNTDAADELQTRVRERLGPLGFAADEVVARTFHKLGLDVIGQATGKRPTVAPWIDNGQDVEHLSLLIDRLKDQDRVFRTQWDLFRMVFGRDLPSLDQEESEPEDWDRDTKKAGFRTLRNEVVKSHGERILANWLFYNGVEYCYERPYEIDLADPQHRQYRPDFYYPAIQAYHEHWALDRNGQPPKEFVGYLASMAWKREKHAEHSTTLLETTSADLWSGEAFVYLERELTARGIVLDPNPDRPSVGRPPIDNRGLVQLFRTFLVHAKSNRLTNEDLQKRLASSPLDRFRHRHHIFLSLFTRVRAAWEASLADAGVIDFEDMLLQASDHVEAKEWVSPFELVMVDEFQDSSQARTRLVRALVAGPTQRLFAVGDDWQSINRFAGADISVMTGFESWFGNAQVRRLERTFRCPQSLCDVSSQFVQQNPSQLRKTVRSDAPEHPPTIQIVQVADDDRIASAVLAHLRALHAGVADGSIPPGKAGKVSVMVLGRYNRDRAHLGQWNSMANHLEVRFHTVHGSKGLEADYVILPRVVTGRAAFPSARQDDPVMLLAMPDGDDHPHAEERRLFYVALTRARRSVLVITVENRFSPFVVELIREHGLEATSVDGAPSRAIVCSKCEKGVMVRRTGSRGPFLGCSRFPACNHTKNVRNVGSRQR